MSTKGGRKKAVTSLAVLIVVVIIVAAAIGAGAYELSSHPASTTSSGASTGTTQSSSSISSSSSAVSTGTSSEVISSITGSQITATSSSCSNSSGASSPSTILSDLFGNFTKMTMRATIVSGASVSSYLTSYSVVNSTGSGILRIYGVELNGTANSSSGLVPETAVFTYGANGTMLGATLNGQSSPTDAILTYLIPFRLELELGSSVPTQIGLNDLKQVNITSITLGLANVTTTNYSPVSVPFKYTYCGATANVSAEQVQTGTITGTTYGPLVTYLYQESSTQAGSLSDTIQVLSLTPATKTS